MSQQAGTNTSNQHFDLVSVLYHALEASTTYDTYIRDAQQQGDQELAQFFEQVKQENTTRADKAKQLLSKRLSQ